MTRSDTLYVNGFEFVYDAVRPGPVRQFMDYAGFLGMNALVEMLEVQRQMRKFLDTDLYLGVVLGAVATVFCFILSGAGW